MNMTLLLHSNPIRLNVYQGNNDWSKAREGLVLEIEISGFCITVCLINNAINHNLPLYR